MQNVSKLNRPRKPGRRNFREPELRTVLTEANQELDQSPRGPPGHAFTQVRHLVFVGHHTRYVQMCPFRVRHELFQERCGCACSCRSEKTGGSHCPTTRKHVWHVLVRSSILAEYILRPESKSRAYDTCSEVNPEITSRYLSSDTALSSKG